MVLGAGKPEIKVSTDMTLGEGLLPGLQMALFLPGPHKAEREKALLSQPLLFFFLIFYLFIHRDTHREREAETQAEGEAGSMQRA